MKTHPEYTLALVKPDGFRARRLVPILSMAERRGLFPEMLLEVTLMEKDVVFLYGHVQEKYPDVWPGLLQFMLSGPCYVMLLKSDTADAVEKWRALMGSTRSSEAAGDTIRGRFGNFEVTWENVVHGSDSDLRAAEELLYFLDKA